MLVYFLGLVSCFLVPFRELLGSCSLFARQLQKRSGGFNYRSIAMGGRAGRSGRKPHLNEDGSRKHKKRERSVPRDEGQTTRKTQGRAVPQPASVVGASEHASDIATCLVNTAVQQSNDARIENERVDAEFEEDEDGNPRMVERLTMPPTVRAQVERVKDNIKAASPPLPVPTLNLLLLPHSP